MPRLYCREGILARAEHFMKGVLLGSQMYPILSS